MDSKEKFRGFHTGGLKKLSMLPLSALLALNFRSVPEPPSPASIQCFPGTRARERALGRTHNGARPRSKLGPGPRGAHGLTPTHRGARAQRQTQALGKTLILAPRAQAPGKRTPQGEDRRRQGEGRQRGGSRTTRRAARERGGTRTTRRAGRERGGTRTTRRAGRERGGERGGTGHCPPTSLLRAGSGSSGGVPGLAE